MDYEYEQSVNDQDRKWSAQYYESEMVAKSQILFDKSYTIHYGRRETKQKKKSCRMREREEKEEYEDSSIYLNSNNHRIENERDSWSPQEVD